MAQSLTQEEIEWHAERIADAVLEDLEYSYVYEDEELEDMTEEDWQAVHSHIQRSLTTVRADRYDYFVKPHLEDTFDD